MDPCPFLRILVGDFALKLAGDSATCDSDSPTFCRIKLKNFPPQFAAVSSSTSAVFTLGRAQIDAFADKRPRLAISVFAGRRPAAGCGLAAGAAGKLVGKVYVTLDLSLAETRACVFHHGWVAIGDRSKKSSRVSSSSTAAAAAQLHVCVRAEPDPRFVFRFDGEPECSPQVFQVQGNVKQPVFTCKFGFRSNSDLKNSSMSEPTTSRTWFSSLKPKKENTPKERKGWSITIHDLSGSPVALASMVTPFVASPGSDRVSRANPGAWLILRPGDGTWKPWGRLEAWRDRSNSLGYKFDLLSESSSTASATLATSESHPRTGKFTVDDGAPTHSPSGSWDLGSGSGSGSRPGSRPGSGSGSDFGFGPGSLRGFVMSSTVERLGGPEVEVGVQHVTCSEDAAAFVAVAAAVDLSVDACRLFSQKLPKELRQ